MEKKEKTYDLVKCIDCAHSYLMQNGDNPIVAGCKKTHEREVADIGRICKWYEKSRERKTINPMFFARTD